MNKYRPLGAMGFLYGFDNTSSRLQFRLKDLLNRLFVKSSIIYWALSSGISSGFSKIIQKKAKICSNIPKPIPKCTFWNFIGTDFRKISEKDVIQEMSVYQSWMFDARFFQLKVASLTSCQWSSRHSSIANRIKHHRFTP